MTKEKKNQEQKSKVKEGKVKSISCVGENQKNERKGKGKLGGRG
jgi:hypothetical protein